MDEVWRDIKGYEGLYKVSNQGRVKSLDRLDNLGRITKGKILNLINDKDGYKLVNLSKNGNVKRAKVHRLVAEAFIDGYFEGACIDHINTIKYDNRVENLRWVTYKENANNELTQKHYRRSEKHHNSRRVYCVELDRVFPTIKQAVKEIGKGCMHVGECCRGTLKTCMGYHWYFEEDIIFKG